MAQHRQPGGTASGAAREQAPSRIAWGSLASPVGDLHVGCSQDGVSQVSFGPPHGGPAGHSGPPGAGSPPPGGAPARARDLLAAAIGQLTGYFAGQRRAFDLPVDWSGTTGTQQQVLSALLAGAGYGQTLTYGALARLARLPDGGDAGSPGQYVPPARVVGQVMGSNPCPVIVPCHRVVAGDGLGGYSGGAGTEIKRWLLIFEGALPPTLDWDPAGAGLPVAR
ncbi:MAG TPA: methylated-DNA--[protein]-cysteine S-methyltransferase [Streptosporangiaceae bacterium]|nr:methylated-DNA--[protein]-cysteine S-methyltransferase [Streptosporangiaceae bacterium]